MTKEQLKQKVLSGFDEGFWAIEEGGLTSAGMDLLRLFLSQAIDTAVEETYKAVKPGEQKQNDFILEDDPEDAGQMQIAGFNSAIQSMEQKYKEFNQ